MAGGGIVYSTEHGRMCPRCEQPTASCTCASRETAVPAGDGVVRVRYETKGRRGKGVTVVTGVPLDASDLTKLGKELKRACGSGGTVKDGAIEVQGDHRERMVAELERRGYRVRRSGG